MVVDSGEAEASGTMQVMVTPLPLETDDVPEPGGHVIDGPAV